MKTALVVLLLALARLGVAGDTLYLYNWNNYISAYTAARFEVWCGCRLQQDYYSDNEEMLAKLEAGATGYDLLVPTGNAVQTLIRKRELLALDHQRLPHLANLDPAFANPWYDPGQRYAVPYATTVTLLGYNATRIAELGRRAEPGGPLGGRGHLYLAARHRGPQHRLLARRAGWHHAGAGAAVSAGAGRVCTASGPALAGPQERTMSAAPPLLQVTGLRKAFGGVLAVDGVDFALAPGEMLALIGPNGAGKSTTFNMVGGQLRPDAGTIELAGVDIAGLPPRAIWQQGVGRTFQIAETFASLTVVENVQMALLSADRRLFSFWPHAQNHRRADALAMLDQVGMAAQALRPCSALAYGDVKRVELAMALSHAPRLLLMDEPTAGMAPAERLALMALTQQLARERAMGVLFTEHSMDVVFAHADRVMVLARGRLLAEGTPQAIRDNAQVQHATGYDPLYLRFGK